jgi:hypothetical protein
LLAPKLDPRVYTRIIELTNKSMDYDRRWHARHKFLMQQGTVEYNIDNDIVLKNLSGATRVMCDMVTGLSAGYMVYREVTGHTEGSDA